MIRDDIKSLPDTPGVYFFRGARGKILYIGKATSLISRVRSYFSNDIRQRRGPHIEKMVREAKRVTYEQTDSVLEALILEARLIKKHQPPYNTRDKDNKSFQYILVTKEEYPRVLLVRGRALARMDEGEFERKYGAIDTVYGPFPHHAALREALAIIRKIFPFRDICTPRTGTPCFNAQIGLCPGVCAGAMNAREYRKMVRHIKTFFSGRKRTLVAALTKEMRRAAHELRFEDAAAIKKRIFALEHINDVSMLKDGGTRGEGKVVRIEAYDIAHTSGLQAIGVMVVVEGGVRKLSDYRVFRIKSFNGIDDTRALDEVLRRRLAHTEWALPDVIVMDGGSAQLAVGESAVRAARAKSNPLVVSVVKDEHHKPKGILGPEEVIARFRREILLANNEAHRFALREHRKRRDRIV